jgi:hypothetical protein
MHFALFTAHKKCTIAILFMSAFRPSFKKSCQDKTSLNFLPRMELVDRETESRQVICIHRLVILKNNGSWQLWRLLLPRNVNALVKLRLMHGETRQIFVCRHEDLTDLKYIFWNIYIHVNVHATYVSVICYLHANLTFK